MPAFTVIGHGVSKGDFWVAVRLDKDYDTLTNVSVLLDGKVTARILRTDGALKAGNTVVLYLADPDDSEVS